MAKSFLPGPLQGFGLTLAQVFKPGANLKYPEVKHIVKPRYHGRHVLNRHPDGLEKCVGCELCAWACPADAIYVEGGNNTDEARFSPGERYAKVYQINYLRCIFCGLCIDNRQDLIFTKAELLSPLLEGMEAPPHPMRLGDDEKDYYVNGPELQRQFDNGTLRYNTDGSERDESEETVR